MLASIREVGVIEPLIVHPQRGNTGAYLLLDGHMRLKALQELSRTEAFCLIARDDDAFTYNDKVNRLSLIQEHTMIMRAIELGVSARRIAKALERGCRQDQGQRELARRYPSGSGRVR